MSFAEQALLFVLIVAGVVVVGAAIAFLVARRALRKRWRAVRAHAATRGLVATASWAGAGREWLGARVSPEAGSRGTATRARRRLWAAIDDAEAAVNHADATDAPVADLPAVCRSLRTVAGQLDTLLRLERRLPLTQARPDAVRVQVADVIRAAHDVQSAALRASSDATEPQIRALVRDASAEVELVAAALARMRSISPG